MTEPTTGAPSAHPTRRQLLSAAPLTAVALAIPATAAATSIPADRTQWEAALATLRQAKAHDDAYVPGWWELWNKCKAACDRVPHFAVRPAPYSGRHEPVTTADDWLVRMARYEVQQKAEGKVWHDPKVPGVVEHFEWQRDLAQAADERDAAIQRLRASFNMDDADEKAEQLGEAVAEAQRVLMATPAPDLAALRWKLDYALADDSTESTPAWSMDFIAQMLADIARLLPEGR